MKRQTIINNTSRPSTIISVLMMLLMLFLPLSSWSSYLIIETDLSSNMHTMTESDMNSNSVLCHSTHSEKVTIDQDACCCVESGLDAQCNGCVHSCTFVKHFSNIIDSFNLYLTQSHGIRYSNSLADTQFPSPPFRPPAA